MNLPDRAALALESLRAAPWYRDQIVAIHVVPPREAVAREFASRTSARRLRSRSATAR